MQRPFSTIMPRHWIGLALLLTVLFSIPAGYGLAQGSATVLLSPQSATVTTGGATTVEIRIENVTGLYGAEVHLTFDPALLEVVDSDQATDGVQILAGSFLKPEVVPQNEVDLANGKIDFAISQMLPSAAVDGSGVLATVTFKGKAAGTSNVNFTNVLLADQSGNPIDATFQNGTVTIAEGDTPTPTNTPEATLTPTPENTPTSTPTPENTPLPSSTPSPAPTPTATPATTATPPPGNILGYHTVRAGETLYCIGRAYGVDPYAIASRNGILNPSLIHAGNVLAIPNVPRVLPAGRVCPAQFDGNQPPSTCRWYHTVATGENLYRIALRYGVSMWTIAETNNILNLNYIRAGQVLCIP